MSKSLSFKDYQLLSAYMDGQLSTREKARVESMLAGDPDFKLAHDEFSRLKKMMKAMPQVKAPRNFTLSAAVAPQKPQRFFLAPALNYAALVTAILFVFLFAGSRLALPFATRQADAPQAMVLSAGDESAALSPTPIPMINWGMDGGARGKGGGDAGATGLGGGPSIASVPENGTGEVIPETMVQGTESPVQKSGDTSQIILGIPDESVQGKELADSNEPTARQPLVVNWLLAGEIGLAVLAVGFAVAAFFIRKRR